MSRSESRRKSSPATEPNVSGPAEQPDLFGEAHKAPEVYVPKQVHVANRLEDLLAQMRAAEVWPWNWSVVRLHTERTFDYLCNLVTDPEAAQRWRERLAAETRRLNASTPPEPPPPPPQDLSEWMTDDERRMASKR
jgi:hypothetical protein